MIDGPRPIFVELADANRGTVIVGTHLAGSNVLLPGAIADDILVGIYPPDAQVPSTNELAAHHRINPATAGKALNRLVDEGLLVKRRGLGMFVADNAPELLRKRRLDDFEAQFIAPLRTEAQRLGISDPELHALLDKDHS